MKKLTRTIAAIIFASQALTTFAANKLIGHWKLDESSGRVIKDSSGNKNDGRFSGKRVKGKFGNAILLKKNFASFAAQESLQVGKSDFSLDCWVLPEKLESGKKQKTLRLISAIGKNSFFVVDLEDGGKPQLEMGIKTDGKWTYCRVTAKDKLALNKWSHLAVVCDRSNRLMKVYIDGDLNAEAKLPKAFMAAMTGNPFNIGSVWQGFEGLVKNVKLAGYSYSDADVKSAFDQASDNYQTTVAHQATVYEPIAKKVKKSFPAPKPAADDSQFGAKISRSMKALATSTPEKRNKVRLLFYGQSIIGQSWTYALGRKLQQKYPHADLTFENRSIGGYTSNKLVKTAKQDLYPYYPDLVIFHDYMPFKNENGTWEEMIAKLRQYTTAEILITTHHYSHSGNGWVQKEYDKQSQMIRDIARKYDCELVEIRKEWKQYMDENNLEMNDLLRDLVHLNKQGCDLMKALVWRHLRYNPEFDTPKAEWIKRIPVKADKDGKIKLSFNGNRIDIVAGKPVANMGTAKLLVDGKAPSANPKAYTFTRTTNAPKGWWPAVDTIASKHPMPQVEEWTLTVTDAAKPVKYTVTGSKTGFDGNGSGDKTFVSNSGRIVIEPKNFCLKPGKNLKKGFQAKWAVKPMFIDTYVPPAAFNPAKDNTTTVTQLIENGPHTLEIIPNGNGPVPIKEIIVYQPQPVE